MTNWPLSFLLVLILLPVGCSTRGDNLPPQEDDGNFILYVSNQSFAISPIDIVIYIDGKKVVDGSFRVGNQHRWVRHAFDLEKGTHNLIVVSEAGDARMEKEFKTEGKHWAVIDYWYYRKGSGGTGPTAKKFSFSISDRSIGFL